MVALLVVGQERVGRQHQVDVVQLLGQPQERLARRLLEEVLDDAFGAPFDACHIDRRHRRLGLGQQVDEALAQRLQVEDARLVVLLVERQRPLQVREDADIVHDDAVVLAGIGAVDAGDGLQQRVVLERLVQIHGIGDRRIVAGQQLLGDDQQLGQLVRGRGTPCARAVPGLRPGTGRASPGCPVSGCQSRRPPTNRQAGICPAPACRACTPRGRA